MKISRTNLCLIWTNTSAGDFKMIFYQQPIKSKPIALQLMLQKVLLMELPMERVQAWLSNWFSLWVGRNLPMASKFTLLSISGVTLNFRISSEPFNKVTMKTNLKKTQALIFTNGAVCGYKQKEPTRSDTNTRSKMVNLNLLKSSRHLTSITLTTFTASKE
jgi:hypothetical protein